MTYAKRVDRNHQIIVQALRSVGWHVEDTSRTGRGFPDLVCAKGGRLELVEVKDGSKPPSARLLTLDEIKVCDAFDRHGVRVRVVNSVDEALAL